MGHKDNAAELYLEFAAESQRMVSVECGSNMAGGSDRVELARAYKYLANHFLNQGDIEQACMYCNKCLEFEEVSFLICAGSKFMMPCSNSRLKRKERHFSEVLPKED
jgi:hypothetical protein